MFSRICFEFRSYFRFQSQNFRSQFNKNQWSMARNMRMPLFAACYACFPNPIHLKDEKSTPVPLSHPASKEEDKIVQKPLSIWARLWNLLIHLVRFCQLMVIFAPTILLLPLAFFKKTEGYWMDLFVKAIERSGVVFIKAFQYLSHRRDMIGP